ncbi:hypothetical protein QJS10_CPA03g00624 [Acorus calamus]|uniref:Uncharacterized protein n=1 Tax=Acorus calamus TaxID=4465 RepID=A0AAV9F4I2_ACOCL|nr:hypothetical protein QJS10_CPA03g00624 [Acorus calamus]
MRVSPKTGSSMIKLFSIANRDLQLLPHSWSSGSADTPPPNPNLSSCPPHQPPPPPPYLQFTITSTYSDYHSYISSPVDSIFNVVISFGPSDHFDRLMNSRSLSYLGRLMQVVANAKPLLKTLFIAGSPPRWQNTRG